MAVRAGRIARFPGRVVLVELAARLAQGIQRSQDQVQRGRHRPARIGEGHRLDVTGVAARVRNPDQGPAICCRQAADLLVFAYRPVAVSMVRLVEQVARLCSRTTPIHAAGHAAPGIALRDGCGPGTRICWRGPKPRTTDATDDSRQSRFSSARGIRCRRPARPRPGRIRVSSAWRQGSGISVRSSRRHVPAAPGPVARRPPV